MEAQTFWRGIWSESKEHHKDEGQNKIDITKDKMMRIMRKMPN